jgi:TM2 domain-containing membrane protein YozV
MFCKECGSKLPDTAVICVKCGVPTGVAPIPSGTSAAKSRVAFVLFGLFLGTLGIHNFYAGYTTRAVIQLLITLLTGWLIVPLIGVWIWVLIEVITVEKDAKDIPFS